MARRPTRAVSVLLIVVCQSTQALAFGGIALFLPLIREEIGLTFSQSGTLAGASTLVYALMQIPSGYLADRVGAKRLFVIGLVGTNALSLTFSLINTYPLLLANQALSGFFRAFVFAPGLLLISSHFPPERRATAMGLFVAGGFSSNILLNSIGPALVDPLGWRLLFALFSVSGLVMVLAYWRSGDPGPAPQPAGSYVRINELPGLFRHRVMWLSGIVQFVRLAVVSGLAFWLPTYLVEDKGFTLQVAGTVAAVGAAMTAPSNFLGGYVSDRLQRPELIIGTSLTVLAATLVLLVNVHGFWLVAGVVAVNSVFVQLYFGPLFAVPIKVLGQRLAGLTSGASNFCANMGGLTFAYTLGAVKDSTGSFATGLYALAALCVVGIIATVALSRLEPEAPPEDLAVAPVPAR